MRRITFARKAKSVQWSSPNRDHFLHGKCPYSNRTSRVFESRKRGDHYITRLLASHIDPAAVEHVAHPRSGSMIW